MSTETVATQGTSQEQPKKYVDLRSKSDQEKKSEDLQYEQQDAKLRLQACQNETNRALVEAKRSLDAEKGMYPFNPNRVIELQNEVTKLQGGLDSLAALEEELF